MKKMGKRLLCLLLAAITVFGMLPPVQSFAADNEELLELCREYAPGSDLYQTTSSLLKADAELGRRFSKKLTTGKAWMVAVFERHQINKTTAFEGIALADIQDSFPYQMAHKDSRSDFESASAPSAYTVAEVKETLAKSLDDALADSGSFTFLQVKEGTQSTFDSLTKVFQFLNKLLSTQKGISKLKNFPTEKLASAKAAMKDMLDYLVELELIDGETTTVTDLMAFAGVIAKAAEMVDLLEKGIKYGLDVAELLNFWFQNCGVQVAVLDELLGNYPLPPEALAAVIQLRETYTDSFAQRLKNSLNKVAQVGVDVGIAALKKAWVPLALVETVTSVVGLVTGKSKESKAYIAGSTAAILGPTLRNSLERAIQAVRDGDESEETLLLVQVLFDMTLENTKTLCQSLKTVAKKDEAKLCGTWLTELDKLTPGKTLASFKP